MITDRLPHRFRYPIQDFLGKAYHVFPVAVRYGKIFWQTYNFLQKSQSWSKEILEKYQMHQLRKLLYHAYENVPYYHRLFNERKLKPEDIKELNDLKKLSSLEKDTFKSYLNEIVAKNVKCKHLYAAETSGTTGKRLRFYQDKLEIEKEWAFVCHQWSRIGYRPGEPRVELRGEIILGSPMQYYLKERVLRLSPHITDKRIAHYYLKKIKSFGARFIHGYPSAIAILAHIVKKYSLEVPFRLKAAFFVSETIYDWQREIVEEVFRCRVFAHYGQAEHVATATECENSNYYHFVPQYGVVEIGPDTHEIIGTSFLNYVNPFIRYKTGDCVSSFSLSECNHCGRNYFPVVRRIEGRLEDFIVTTEDTFVSPTALSWYLKPIMNKYLKTIKESQLVQTSVNNFIFRVSQYDKSGPKIRKADLQRFQEDLRKVLGSDILVKLEIVNEIERLQSGKFKRIVSEVSKDFFEKGVHKF